MCVYERKKEKFYEEIQDNERKNKTKKSDEYHFCMQEVQRHS